MSLTEPPKRPLLNSARSSLRKPSSVSEDFWTSSAFDMDTSAVQSQGSISSISTVNHALDPPSNQLEFVNHGEFSFDVLEFSFDVVGCLIGGHLVGLSR